MNFNSHSNRYSNQSNIIYAFVKIASKFDQRSYCFTHFLNSFMYLWDRDRCKFIFEREKEGMMSKDVKKTCIYIYIYRRKCAHVLAIWFLGACAHSEICATDQVIVSPYSCLYASTLGAFKFLSSTISFYEFWWPEEKCFIYNYRKL